MTGGKVGAPDPGAEERLDPPWVPRRRRNGLPTWCVTDRKA
jgi:hypothetical protein